MSEKAKQGKTKSRMPNDHEHDASELEGQQLDKVSGGGVLNGLFRIATTGSSGTLRLPIPTRV